MATATVETLWFTQLTESTKTDNSNVTSADTLNYATLASTLVVGVARTTNAVAAHQTLAFSLGTLNKTASVVYLTESAKL